MTTLRKYLPNAEVGDDGVWHIARNPTNYDSTLCGIADEGMGNARDESVYQEKEGNLRGVTCTQCRAIVDFCKTIKP